MLPSVVTSILVLVAARLADFDSYSRSRRCLSKPVVDSEGPNAVVVGCTIEVELVCSTTLKASCLCLDSYLFEISIRRASIVKRFEESMRGDF